MIVRGIRARRRDAILNHPAWRHIAFTVGAVEIVAVAAAAILMAVPR